MLRSPLDKHYWPKWGSHTCTICVLVVVQVVVLISAKNFLNKNHRGTTTLKTHVCESLIAYLAANYTVLPYYTSVLYIYTCKTCILAYNA